MASCKKEEIAEEPAPAPVTTVIGTSWISITPSFDGYGKGLCVYNDNLFVAGNFFTVGSQTAFGCARYDGNSLSGIDFPGIAGSGFRDFHVYNSQLIGYGSFYLPLGAINNSAIWNGTEWIAGPYSVSGAINDMISYQGSLVAGGFFNLNNSVNLNRIAIHDGTQWQPMSTGFNDEVHALAVFNDTLYAAGRFTSNGISNTTLSHIAKWNGSTWVSVGQGINGIVYDLVVYRNELIACGDFTTAGSANVKNIAAWNGSSWRDLGGGIFSYSGFAKVNHMLEVGGELLICGAFLQAGSLAVRNVTAWNGTSYRPIGSNLLYEVADLAFYKEHLYATEVNILGATNLLRFE